MTVAKSVCRVTGAKQVLQVTTGESVNSANALFQRAYFLYSSLLVFALSVGIGWDFSTPTDPKASFLRPLTHALDVFARPGAVNPVTYLVGLLPVLLVLVTLGASFLPFRSPTFESSRSLESTARPYIGSFRRSEDSSSVSASQSSAWSTTPSVNKGTLPLSLFIARYGGSELALRLVDVSWER
jgi:hypothetical protein